MRATDPDGDPLTFRLGVHPDGMSIDASGVLRWPAPQGPDPTVAVQVDDGLGGTTAQTFTLHVEGTATNRPPVITSTPVYFARAVIPPTQPVPYDYAVTASDPDGDPLTYTLTVTPRTPG